MISFDFIYSFGQWLIDHLQPILDSNAYNSQNGTFYQYLTAYTLQYLAYIAFIIAIISVISFVLGLFINLFYKIKEFF